MALDDVIIVVIIIVYYAQRTARKNMHIERKIQAYNLGKKPLNGLRNNIG